MSEHSLTSDPWSPLRSLTDARIGLGRAGAAIPTGETLRFKLAHAQARDAVHAQLDIASFSSEILRLCGPVHLLQSAATSRTEYLKRPDLGRRLNASSRELLEKNAHDSPDLAIVVADGLSARAIATQAIPFLTHFLPLISQFQTAFAIVEQGRVAIGDEIGHLLHARAVAVLIGERPGLSSPDSMGIYLTFAPQPGLTDERRNCISNIRPAGLTPALAAGKLHWLLCESFRRELSGVALKDDMPPPSATLPDSA